VGCEKRVLSILLSESTTRVAKGHAKHRASGAAWVAKNECCQFSFHSLFFFKNRQREQQLVAGCVVKIDKQTQIK
jgi:hypothetical protein